MSALITKPIRCDPIIPEESILKEEWKDIHEYEGLYKISNWGRVWSCKQNKILILHRCNNNYVYVALHKNNKVKTFRIHRLVAYHFIDNPNNLAEVNHIDEDKDNNCILNLEYCSHKYNCNHGTRIYRSVKGNSKPVICIETGIIYPSGAYADRMFGHKQGKIASVLSNKSRLKTAYGFHWEFVD